MLVTFCSDVLVNHDSMTASHYAQYQDSDSKAAKWNSAVSQFIIYSCEVSDYLCEKANQAHQNSSGDSVIAVSWICF